VTLFVDTSVWSLAFRRDAVSSVGEIITLQHALEDGDTIVTTGLVSCPVNNIAFVAMKMGRRQGARRAHI
jgi:hypothetical protein